ncbi:MAG TPA: NCS2 family permease [Phenylobacterium sp.]|jgi:AGZA family xanthine/uracil permease-like MFS transporter|uniref:NCS2 family permease n=1 Tax=Phenylobacterium conjunctum TaxID=1298959 RepID=A0ABW3T968_9CAUL|nr:NCS2 family permease [Phenylobacterium sp.]HQN50248.1 NCS2 family permease [Phenylobacterium sp.]
MSLLDRLFDLKARGTTVRTEVLAGATTFMTMAYIILVNPSILSQAGLPAAGVAAATCLAAGVGCLIMGLFANYPIALAPGMGLNAYFTFTVVLGMGVPWRVALGLVFISGVVFLFLTLTGVRRLIVSAIPRALFAAIAAGIGLFIAFIGLKSAGLVVANPATTVALGDVKQPMTLLALGGLALIAVLEVLKVRGGILIGIVATTLVGWAAGLVHWNPQAYSVAEMTSTAFQLDLKGALGLGGHGIGLALVEILFVFVFVDLFDNVGTLVAVTTKAGLVAPDGTIPRLNRILVADAAATTVGALAGTSTVVSYIESASGVSAGGRTGLTAVVVGLLFLVALFAAPLAQAIPAAATAPALILVGAMMMAPLADIDWADPSVAIPAFLTLVAIPLTFSIANGLAFGVIAYVGIRALTGRLKRGDWLLAVLAVLFIARFAYMAAA